MLISLPSNATNSLSRNNASMTQNRATMHQQ